MALCIILVLWSGMIFYPADAYGAAAASIGDLTLSTSRSISGKGYSWNAKTRTLTLENANLSGTFRLPGTGDVTILLKGENTITVPSSSKGRAAVYTTGRDLGTVTIRGDGTGSLLIHGFVSLGRAETLRIENCILSVNSDNSTMSQSSSWGTFATTTTTYITDSRLYLSDGMNLGGDHIIDKSYIEVRDDNLKDTWVDIDGDMSLINQSEFHIKLKNSDDYAISGDGFESFYADSSSAVEIINEQGDYCINLGGNIDLQCERLYMSAKKAVFYIRDFGSENSQPTSITLPENAVYEDSIEKLTKLDYTAPSYTERMERIKAGVRATTITLRSAYTAKGNIRITWKKSPGYRMDYYEVFRSTRRCSGYTKKAFYTTDFGLNNTYTNTAAVAGTMYYYKVRGAREVDGKIFYTQWSAKAWRRAK